MAINEPTSTAHPKDIEILKLHLIIENLKYLLRLAITQQPVGERLTREELRVRAERYIGVN
jgi:hypothetical protein